MKTVATLPLVRVELAGAPLDSGLAAQLGSIRVRQRLSAPAQCELSFHGAVERELPVGADLGVSISGHDAALFSGQVTAIEHVFGGDRDRELIVRAYDPLHRLRKSQRARTFTQTTVEALARELAGGLGLEVEAAAAGPVWVNLVQHRESDLELLVVLAERCGLYPVVRDGTLHLITLEGEGEPVPLRLGQELLEARVERNGDRACRRVTAAGWDPLRAEAHQASASSPRVSRDEQAEVSPSQVGASGEASLLGEFASAEDHLLGLAQAELDVRVAGEVTLWGLADGDPLLRAGSRVLVSGLAPGLDGTYTLTDVAHTVDPGMGFVSELSSAAPQVRGRRSAAVAALGEVSSVDDPDGRGRVRVRLPAYGDVESDWLGVVVAGAGRDRGLVALPDVGDAVLVLFAHEDPATGIVLGGLYGSGGPPDPGVEGAAVRRFTLRSSGGQRIVLDDHARALHIEDEGGSVVSLAPGAVTIHAAADLTIEAPGRALLLRARSIDFERA